MSDRSGMVLGYIPEFIAGKEPIKFVLTTLGITTGAAMDDVKDILAQGFVDTVAWGIKYWEEFLGIPVNESKPLSQRRSVVKARLLGAGTTTLAKVRETADSFDNGEVEVTVVPSEFKVQIKYTSIYGVPPNSHDFNQAIQAIIPAHLLLEYVYTYLTWQQLDNTGITWGGLEIAALTWGQLEVWNPN